MTHWTENPNRAHGTGLSGYLGTDRAPAPRAVRFTAVGDSVEGVIAALTMVPDYDPRTRQPKRDREGRIVEVLRIDLDTASGPAALYVGGSVRAGSGSVRDAVASALRAAGVAEPVVGGRLRVEHVGTRPSEQAGFADAKTYHATYSPPADRAAWDRAATEASPF